MLNANLGSFLSCWKHFALVLEDQDKEVESKQDRD